jgi:hypothetical protein
MKCACCGAYMIPDKELENTIIYECKECGLSDSKLRILANFPFSDDYICQKIGGLV